MDSSTEATFVTPPTIYLPPEGIRITLIGTHAEWIERLTDSLENTFPTVSITFYHLDSTSASQWEWLMAMSDLSDLVFVDVGSATKQEMLISFLHLGNKLWFSVPDEDYDTPFNDIALLCLLNTINANVFSSTEQLHNMLRVFLADE
jgi:hypothetical protein